MIIFQFAYDEKDRRYRRLITLIVIIGFAVMLSAAIWAYNQDNSITPHPAQQSESIDGFRRIQAEPRRAIRRALLIDYIKAHPQSPVLGGAQQQLRVMNDYEAADWAELSDIIFDDTLPILDKQFALDRYIASWGEGLVGSRDSDIIAFKSSLATALEAQNGTTPPSRKFIPEKSPIPDNITASQMVGGRVVRRIRPTYPAPPPPPKVTLNLPRERITPARIRTLRTPEYPRRAFRRGIPAVVELSLNVDERGRVGLVEVVNIEAPRYASDFERAARRAAKRTRFHPKTVNGKPAPARDIRKKYVFDPDI